MAHKTQGTPVNPNPDYQDRDIRVMPIVYFVVGMTVLTIVCVLAMAAMFRYMDHQAAMSEKDIPAEARERILPPEPRLIPDEPMALKAYRESARRILEGYAVLDEEKGIVRIPVADAIELVVERGLPQWYTGAPAVASSTDVQPDETAPATVEEE